MDIEMILQKFAVFSGLAGAELRACLPYCHDAMEELTARRRSGASRGGASRLRCGGACLLPLVSGTDERQQPAPCRGGGAGEPYDPCGGKGAV